MTLDPDEFMRRFLLHVLPSGFHRIRHYGLLNNARRRENLANVRALLQATPVVDSESQTVKAPTARVQPTFVCPDCGTAMIIIEVLVRRQPIRGPPQERGAS